MPNAFSNGTVADADEVNANFAAVENEVSDNDARWAEFKEPMHSVMVDPDRKMARTSLMVLVPILVAFATFNQVKPSLAAPSSLRSIHPSAPGQFDFHRLVEATEGFSGAEIEQVVIAALYRGLHLKQPLDTELLVQEISETVPLSISRREDMQKLREMSRGRFVSVN